MKLPVLADPRLWGWLAIALAGGVLIHALSPILAPFLAGAIFAYVLNPLVGRLTGRYLPRVVAVVLVLLFALALAVALALVIVPLFIKELRMLAERLPAFLIWLNQEAAPWLKQRFAIDVQLDIGHPAIFRSLIASANVSSDIAEQAFVATDAKDVPALKSLEARLGAAYQAIAALPTLYGDASALTRAAEILPDQKNIADALSQLLAIEKHFAQQGIKVSVDLGELGGFNYESGITFAAFARGAPDAIARGGRYDEIGKAFGRARPATGFSMDLKALLPLVKDEPVRGAILGPLLTDAAARAEMAKLRASGETVIARLPGHDAHLDELGCDRQLSLISGRWTTVPLP